MTRASFGEAKVEDVDGGVVELRTLWRRSAVVLVFVRHFG